MEMYQFSDGVKKFAHYADWPLVVIAVLLIGIGLIAVWSFSPVSSHLSVKQALWAAIGIGVSFGFSILDYRIFKNHGLMLVGLYLLAVASLALLLVFAPATRGVKAWFQIGRTGIQPVEATKLVLVLVLAKYFSRRHIEIARLRHLVISGLYVGFASLLVLLQPDLGSAIILGAIWLAVVFFSGIRWRHLAIFFVLSAAVAVLSWFLLLAPYQKVRITSFFDPYRDPRGSGYNAIQSMIAAGSGRMWGRGIGYGTQSHLNFLPEAPTDFAFAAFAEETGFIGASLLLVLLGALFWRVIAIGIRAQDNFSKLFVLGFSASLFAALAIHVGMNLGFLPVTGIGLPFISYGGSSLITNLAGLGILQSIRIHSRSEIG